MPKENPLIKARAIVSSSPSSKCSTPRETICLHQMKSAQEIQRWIQEMQIPWEGQCKFKMSFQAMVTNWIKLNNTNGGTAHNLLLHNSHKLLPLSFNNFPVNTLPESNSTMPALKWKDHESKGLARNPRKHQHLNMRRIVPEEIKHLPSTQQQTNRVVERASWQWICHFRSILKNRNHIKATQIIMINQLSIEQHTGRKVKDNNKTLMLMIY